MIKKISVVIVSCMLTSISFADGKGDKVDKGDWKLAKDKNGLKCYTKKEEGSSLLNYKVEVTFDCTIQETIQLLGNIDDYTGWVYTCIESKILKKIDEKNYIYYNQFKAPWPVSNRDLIVDLSVGEVTDEKADVKLTCNASYIDDVDGVVRMPEYEATWVLTKDEDGKTYAVHIGFMNPGGSLPAWLVNTTITDGPYDSIYEMKQLLEK